MVKKIITNLDSSKASGPDCIPVVLKNSEPLTNFEKLLSKLLMKCEIEKYGLFSDFRYGFRSSQSTSDLLTVLSDRISRAFNRSGATRVVALDISKPFYRFGILVFFTNLSLKYFQVGHLAIFFSQ